MLETERLAKEFDKVHEGEHGHVIDGMVVIYSDGATRSVATYGLLGYELHEPPTDPDKLVKLQKKFWEIRLQNLVHEYDTLRLQAQQSAKTGTRFQQRLAELKELQTKVRQARSKLAVLVIAERGYSQPDVTRAWDAWERFSEAVREENQTKTKFDSALLNQSSAGKLEKLKFAFDQAKAQAAKCMEAWNKFSPPQARVVVAQELDQRSRSEREQELATIGEI